MTGLPKAIIKKYGVTKKAWAVFRGRKSRSSSPRRATKKAQVVHMARRRFRKSGRSRSISGSNFKPLMDAAIGGAIAGAVLGIVPSKYNTTTTRVVAGGAAAYMGKGIIRDAGKALITLEAARLASSLAGGMTSTTGSQSITLY